MQAETLNALYASAGDGVWQTPAEERPDWAIVVRELGQLSPGDVLDIGCFDGRFLSLLADRWRKFGLEINEAAARAAREAGVDILGADFRDLARFEQRFDAVTAFDVIEHVENPAQFLRLCAQVLRRGGLLAIATGNTDSLPWRLHGARNLYCIWAKHLSFINPAWCEHEGPRSGLRLRSVIRYRRNAVTWSRWVRDMAANAAFAEASWSKALLRNLWGSVA